MVSTDTLHGANIICFAKDWTEDPTSCNYVMRGLARHNQVLWLNSIASRAPKVGSARDMAKIRRKVRDFLDGPQTVEPGLSVFTPLVLPFPHSDMAVAMNKRIMRGMTWALRKRLGMEGFQLWTFLPTAVRYLGTLGESLVVYYITDEWTQFSAIDPARIAAMEEELCQRADVVFCTSLTLLERKKKWNPDTYLASHGVDQAHFARALEDDTEVPPEVDALPGPRIGFFGLIEEWIDIDLVGWLAQKRPDWSFVMIGTCKVDRSHLDGIKNIHWLGRKPYSTLPAYCKGFDVGLMPFAMTELTRHVNPIKLREYLSAGLPVVSTDIPECKQFPADCFVGHDREEILAMCDKAIAEDSPEKRRARSEAMTEETWERKVEALGEHVRRVAERKGRIH